MKRNTKNHGGHTAQAAHPLPAARGRHDPRPVCVKIAALNLSLAGGCIGEIMCADTARGDGHFEFGYSMSLVPFGLYRITERVSPRLWQINRQANLSGL